jgi:Tol biopolymer transport system component
MAPDPSAPSQTPEDRAHPLAGLTFSTGQGFWLVDAQGVPQLLVDQSRGHLSPDGQYLAYQAPDAQGGADDIWTMDLANGEKRNLTNTPERFEEDPEWWPGRSDVVVFSSDVECCMASRELPTTVGLDGSGYKIIDENNGGARAISPDGELMVYAAYQPTGWMTRVGHAPEAFDPAAYGVSVKALIQPAFSPDSRVLAWMVSGDLDANGSSDSAVALFDLPARTGRLIHRYTPTAGGEFPSQLAWSPDGEWLAFVTFGEPPASGRVPNLWVVRADGSQEKYLAAGSSPVWSPNSQSLAFLEATTSGQPEPRLVNMTSFEVAPMPTALPAGISFLLDWVQP